MDARDERTERAENTKHATDEGHVLETVGDFFKKADGLSFGVIAGQVLDFRWDHDCTLGSLGL